MSSGQDFPIGVNYITYIMYDTSGNQNSCNFTLVVVDIEDPVIENCSNNIINETDVGKNYTNITWTPAPTATDNDAVVSFDGTHDSGDLFYIGVTTVNYTAVDPSGNIAVCIFNVTIEDKESPTLNYEEDPVITGCPMNIVLNTTSMLPFTNATWMTPNATDNSGNVTLVSTHNPGDGFAATTSQVTYTATDPYGNKDICTFNVTVVDAESPTLNCVSNVTVHTDLNSATANVSWPIPETTDNSGIEPTLTSNYEPYTLFNIGTTLVMYTSTDASDNVQTCMFNVTVIDEEDPVITGCPMNIVLNTTSMLPFTNATWMTPNATDNSGNVTLVSTHNPGDGFAETTTQVTYTATDSYGNKDICTFNVTVIDTESPTLDCVSNVTVYTDLNSATANVSWPIPETTDNSGLEPTLTSNYEPYTLFDIGTTLVMYTSTDASNNMQSCMFNVTVIDNEDPLFDCPSGNITAYTDESQSYSTVYWNVSVTDNSGNVTYNCTRESGDQFDAVWPIIQHNVSCIAQDLSGNDASCFFSVTVDDNENPNITCPSDFNVTTSNGQPTAWIQWNVEYTDNTESLYNLSLTGSGPSYNQSGENFPIGTTILEYIVTDAFGNSVNCTFYVTVRDEEDPVISSCPMNIVLNTTSMLPFTNATWMTPNATDNSGNVTLISTHNPGDGFAATTTQVTYTATDPYGNKDICTFNVTVIDAETPTLNCVSNVTVYTDLNSATANVSWPIPETTDNIGLEPTLTSNYEPYTLFDIGTTLVMYTSTDASTNMQSCMFNVTVIDNEDPIFDCPSGNIMAYTDESQSYSTVYWNVSVTDNSGNVTYNCTRESGDQFEGVWPIIQHNVSCIAQDPFGNDEFCFFSVTVDDNENPNITCPSDFNVTTDNGQPTAWIQWDVEYTDNTESLYDLSLTGSGSSYNQSGENFPIGTTILEYIVTDAFGNSVNCTFYVTVRGEN
ncbi:hyalin-like [Antedon mediterranea]|uniref:hyalin-like n=1 Tax=Antedon mediterranea TaxID=105859 RepID=UPI003AF96515